MQRFVLDFAITYSPLKEKKKVCVCVIEKAPVILPPKPLSPTAPHSPSTILSDIDHPYLLSWGVACLDNTAQIAEINQKQSSYKHPQGAKLHKTSARQKKRKRKKKKREGGKKTSKRKSEGRGKKPKHKNKHNNAGEKEMPGRNEERTKKANGRQFTVQATGSPHTKARTLLQTWLPEEWFPLLSVSEEL